MSAFAKFLDLLPTKRSSKVHARPASEAVGGPIDPIKLERLHELLLDIPTSGDEANAWNDECSALIQDLVVSRVADTTLASIFAGLVSYQKTGVTPSHSHYAFVEAFDQSSGLFQEILHYSLFPRLDDRADIGQITSPHFGAIDSETRTSIVDEIRKNGYCVLPFKLSATCVASLNACVQEMSFHTKEPQVESVPDILHGLDPSNPPLCGAAYAMNQNIESSPAFMDLANDPLIVRLASEYLQTQVTPINSVLWYSFAAKAASSDLAQLFHYDLDTVKWLKVFYYLNEVTEDNGPHEYVEGSHNPGTKSTELLQRGYVRIPDQDIARLQSGRIRSITGSAGTVILGDTRAFHKGKPLISGHRLLYQPIYAASRISYVQSK